MENDTNIAEGAIRPRPLLSRATILILALVLLSMGAGAQLSHDHGSSLLKWGGFGLVAYLALELAARFRSLRECFQSQSTASRKLNQLEMTDLAIQFGRRKSTGEAQPQPPGEACPTAPKFALVIDDEPQVAKLIKRMLTTEGILVRSCERAQEALELAHDAICVLCDVHLAGVHGADVVRSLRQHGYSGPVVMMSGDSRRSVVEGSLGAGIDDYLIKPFDEQTLLKRVRRLVDSEAVAAH
jgi:CheY-like chemotaxis protein